MIEKSGTSKQKEKNRFLSRKNNLLLPILILLIYEHNKGFSNKKKCVH